jgi:hypothetical protein
MQTYGCDFSLMDVTTGRFGRVPWVWPLTDFYRTNPLSRRDRWRDMGLQELRICSEFLQICTVYMAYLSVCVVAHARCLVAHLTYFVVMCRPGPIKSHCMHACGGACLLQLALRRCVCGCSSWARPGAMHVTIQPTHQTSIYATYIFIHFFSLVQHTSISPIILALAHKWWGCFPFPYWLLVKSHGL